MSINVTPSEVKSICGEVAKIYIELEGTINDMVNEVNNSSEFWTSSQATKFVEELHGVHDNYKLFYEKYNNFLSFINDSMGTYDEQRGFNDSDVDTYATTTDGTN